MRLIQALPPSRRGLLFFPIMDFQTVDSDINSSCSRADMRLCSCSLWVSALRAARCAFQLMGRQGIGLWGSGLLPSPPAARPDRGG